MAAWGYPYGLPPRPDSVGCRVEGLGFQGHPHYQDQDSQASPLTAIVMRIFPTH